jgi:hypothetical protein
MSDARWGDPREYDARDRGNEWPRLYDARDRHEHNPAAGSRARTMACQPAAISSR